MGAVDERVHVEDGPAFDVVVVAGGKPVDGNEEAQDGVRQLADDEHADDGDERHRDVVVKSSARCQPTTTHSHFPPADPTTSDDSLVRPISGPDHVLANQKVNNRAIFYESSHFAFCYYRTRGQPEKRMK